MKKDDEGVVAATLVMIVYGIGMMIILKKFEGDPAGFWIWVIWTLAVVLFVVLHDYIEDTRNSVHDKIREVSRAEMRFLEERKKFYEEVENDDD